jgi:hypothetical protein
MNAYLFRPGVVVATPAALEALAEAKEEPSVYLCRHLSGDWGELDAFDKLQNESALENDYRILSAYVLGNGTRIWIITEADRSSTCVLLPSDY